MSTTANATPTGRSRIVHAKRYGARGLREGDAALRGRAGDNKMVWRWDGADPFGLDQPDENPSRLSAFTYNSRFPGQVFDKETNNHYNYYRDYDPQTGRYIQSDPIGLGGGINTYGYVGGNPVIYSDLLGLAPGDSYRTANQAAVAAIMDIYPKTAASGNEWGGRVYRTPDGKYSYTPPAEGNRKDIGHVPSLSCPNGGTNVRMYHTHPNVRPHPNGTGNPNIVSGGDQYWGAHYVSAQLNNPSSVLSKVCRAKKGVGDIDIGIVNLNTGDIMLCEVKTVFDRFRTNHQLSNFVDQRVNYEKAVRQLRATESAIVDGHWKIGDIFETKAVIPPSGKIFKIILTWWDIFDPFKGTAIALMRRLTFCRLEMIRAGKFYLHFQLK
jgi:RHS repeat-associated protein